MNEKTQTAVDAFANWVYWELTRNPHRDLVLNLIITGKDIADANTKVRAYFYKTLEDNDSPVDPFNCGDFIHRYLCFVDWAEITQNLFESYCLASRANW